MEQQLAWEREYSHAQGVPTTTRSKASSALTKAVEFFQSQNLHPGERVLDLGCGPGRNAIWLAERGYDVTAIDFAPTALEALQEAVARAVYAQRVHTQRCDLARPLPFADGRFDLVLDITTTISLDPEGLVSLERELWRVTRPGGLFVSYVISTNDEVLAAKAPGHISTVMPESGIRDYYRSEEEMRSVYHRWKILKLVEKKKTDFFYGQEYTRRLWWLLAQKP